MQKEKKEKKEREAEYFVSLTTKHHLPYFFCNILSYTYYALVYWPTKIVNKTLYS